MLLVVKRPRVALHVAVLPLLASLAVGAAALHAISSVTSRGGMLASFLTGGMVVYVIFTTRLVRARAHTVVVRSLLDTKTFDARAAAFGVSATYNARAVATYTVYITDGMRRSDIAAYSTHRSLAAADRLTTAFAVANRGGSSEARGVVAREIATWKAREEQRRGRRATASEPEPERPRRA
jgi:hypothetical protein